MTHLQQHACGLLRDLVSGANRWCVRVQWCDTTSEFQLHMWRSTGLKIQSEQFPRDSLLLMEPQCGYAGVRLGEERNPGPAEHERDHAEEPSARQTSMNEAGNQVPEAKTPSQREFNIRTPPRLSPLTSNLPLAHSPIPAQSETSQTPTTMHNCFVSSTELLHWPFRGALYRATAQRGQRALK